jgi:hypothetical protein
VVTWDKRTTAHRAAADQMRALDEQVHAFESDLDYHTAELPFAAAQHDHTTVDAIRRDIAYCRARLALLARLVKVCQRELAKHAPAPDSPT